jgi:CRISPR/Cas system CSM-associated protein Csm3 (group 7 of RAMP superfamily)
MRYTLKLRSDAEPGTGLGTELIDDLVPRDERGRPMIPASHVKGLLRQSLLDIADLRNWDRLFVERLLGAPGDAATDGVQGLARFSDLRCDAAPSVALITRTAIDAVTSTKRDGSLRTTECIAVGSEFRGQVWIDGSQSRWAPLMLELALASLSTIGGNRRRGSGLCRVRVDGSKRRPSELLAKVESELSAAASPVATTAPSTPCRLAAETVEVELTFTAMDPVCCPEVPMTRTNLLRGGFSIPASAVQGAILDRLNSIDPSLATATFDHAGFRAWPLLPIGLPDAAPADDCFPVWTSLTHRMAKEAAGVDVQPMFADSMLEPEDLRDTPRGAPLKAADGVLLRQASAGVELWRAKDMPRHLSAHVSLEQSEPELFTVDACAPMVFRGLLSLPSEAWEVLGRSIGDDGNFWFGKSRSTRGGGTMRARRLDSAMSAFVHGEHQVFVVQSPLLVHSVLDSGREHAGMVLKRLVEAAGLGTVKRAEATLGMRFGWNRRAIGERTAGRNRLRAQVVVLPGSVFRLESAREIDATVLARGIGGGRERGFGAFLPHPGKAARRWQRPMDRVTLKSKDNAGQLAVRLLDHATDGGLTASQVSWLAEIAKDGLVALKGRKEQLRTESTPRSYARWKTLLAELESILAQGTSASVLARALRGVVDGLKSQRSGKEER